jgi:hypothetical protein
MFVVLTVRLGLVCIGVLAGVPVGCGVLVGGGLFVGEGVGVVTGGCWVDCSMNAKNTVNSRDAPTIIIAAAILSKGVLSMGVPLKPYNRKDSRVVL